MDENTTEGEPQCPGFVLHKTSSGPLKAVLRPGLEAGEAEVALGAMSEREDVAHVDVTTYPTEPAKHDPVKMARLLLPLALKPNIMSITLQTGSLAHRVKGACTGIVVDIIRGLVGNVVTILGTEIKLRDLIKPNDILAKFIVDDEISSDQIDDTCRVLRHIKTMTDVPYCLDNAVTKAAKIVRQIRKERNRILEATSPSDLNSEPEHQKLNKPADDISNKEGIPQQLYNLLGRKGHCYVCREVYNLPKTPRKLDSTWIQYPRMCHACASYNFQKRTQGTDLQGKYAVVTGGRIKIGYHIVLKLLRDGCTVIATTRFPRNAAARFQKEPDFEHFKDRLKLYPMDLKDMNSVSVFIDYVKQTFPHLDILINNAAQTTRRPREFFDHLLPMETEPYKSIPDSLRTVLATESELKHTKICPQIPNVPKSQSPECTESDSTNDEAKARMTSTKRHLDPEDTKEGKFENTKKHKRSEDTNTGNNCEKIHLEDAYQLFKENETGPESRQPTSENPLSGSPTSSPIPSTSTTVLSTYFPPGQLDEDGQQLDLRLQNSWVMGMEQVPVSELLEVMAINSVAPFILIQHLKPWLDRSPQSRRFIVNVSAMEGQFSRIYKTHCHPHTNMAKAALNMLTRTAGVGFQEAGVFMTAVDTGWVTDMRPHVQAKHEQEKGFMLPLDVVDGAARVYDPVVRGYRDRDTIPDAAVFLKDYKIHPW